MKRPQADAGRSRRFHFSGLTNKGRIRPNNEDALILQPEIGLFGVCDGMGGHASGEVASTLAAEIVTAALQKAEDPLEDDLEFAILEANAEIYGAQKKNLEHRGMGTTISTLWFPSDEGDGLAGHVGDSRIYVFRDDTLTLMTEDHTPVFRLHKAGMLSREEIRRHPQRNLLDRALGTTAQVEVDMFTVAVHPDDLFLICSDGLSGCLEDSEIEAILGGLNGLTAAAEELIQASNDRGGFDNISVVLVQPIRR